MNKKIAVIKVKLLGTKLSIWRRIEVPYKIRLHQLHNIIQEAMGWDNYHLYAFHFPDSPIGYALIEEVGDINTIDAKKAWFPDIWGPEKKCIYTYDFGDEWNHEITFEKLIDGKQNIWYPRCTNGKGKCPPEDVGGAAQYEKMLTVLKGPGCKEKTDLQEWLELNEEETMKYDPSAFDKDEANERLVNLGKKLEPSDEY